MKEMKSQRDKEREYLGDEESSKYWDEHDASELLESAEKIALEVAKPDYRCTNCGSHRIRKRMIDLPILDDTVVLRRTKILFCAQCKASVIEKAGFEQVKDRLHSLAMQIDAETLHKIVAEGLASYEKKWAERENERKVISIYFSTRKGIPAKAQISLAVSDPLYPRLRSLTSEDVRKMLNLPHLEDLEREAQKEKRAISQYLKLELAKRLLDDYSKPSVERKARQEARHIDTKVRTLHITPRRIDPSYLRQEQLRTFSLAAKSEEGGEIVLLESTEKEFVGVLHYDYATAALIIDVLINAISLSLFDAELTMNDNTVQESKHLRIENDKILLLRDTDYTEDNVSEITLRVIQ